MDMNNTLQSKILYTHHSEYSQRKDYGIWGESTLAYCRGGISRYTCFKILWTYRNPEKQWMHSEDYCTFTTITTYFKINNSSTNGNIYYKPTISVEIPEIFIQFTTTTGYNYSTTRSWTLNRSDYG